MSRENERRNNARRLAFALYERMNDAQTVARLATVLHYLPEQLRADIADLESYTADKVAEDRSADAD